MVEHEKEEKESDDDQAELLTLVCDYFAEADDLGRNGRQWSEKCRDYYDGNQLTSEQLAVYNARRQPPTINNRIQPMVDFLVGIEIRARTDPKAFPRTMSPQADNDAQIAGDAVKFVTDTNNFDDIASMAMEHMIIEGPCGVSVDVEGKGDKRKIVLRWMDFNRFFYDPYSADQQFKDAKYTGYITWMDDDDAEARWPDANWEAIKKNLSEWNQDGGRQGETYDDEPRWYFNRSGRKRIMVVEMYFIHKGKWHHAIYCKDSWLKKPKVSAYMEEDKFGDEHPANAHICAAPKRMRKTGERYGLVRTKLSMQDAINARHNKAIDILNRHQTFAKEGTISDVEKFKRQANDSGGHIETPAGPGEWGKDYGIIPTEQLGQTHFQMYKDDLMQLEALTKGAIAADNETNLSGRALRQLEGARSLEIQGLANCHSRWKVRVYQAIWNRIRQFWTQERWIRVTDNPDSAKFAKLNHKVTMRDVVMQKMGGKLPPEMANDPRLDEPVKDQDGKQLKLNDVSQMGVDIFLEEVPDYNSLMEEQFELLVEMYRANPDPAKNGIPWEKVIKASRLRDKEALLSQTPKTPEEQAEVQRRMQEREQMGQLQKASAQADVAAKQAKAQKEGAAAQQTQLENMILANSPITPTNLSI